MKTISVTTIVLAVFSLLSAIGYILAGYYSRQNDSAHSVALAPGFVQIAAALLLAYSGINAIKSGPNPKVILGISWVVFIGFSVWAISQ